MYIVYVLYSPAYKKIYIGFTSNLNQRMLSHNILEKDSWTARYRPWELIHTESFVSKHEAMKREKALKGGRGRQWIKNYLLSKS